MDVVILSRHAMALCEHAGFTDNVALSRHAATLYEHAVVAMH